MPLCKIVVSRSIPGALVDVEGHAFTAYGAVPGTVVHVRPDGSVGAVMAAS